MGYIYGDEVMGKGAHLEMGGRSWPLVPEMGVEEYTKTDTEPARYVRINRNPEKKTRIF
jgi:hypothetical protein